ncbi:MAG: hypothetical protein EXR67_04175 [Dehalococcoidia bacterium]|nr:hypothetical protein [Dehalococcoidia bacterium]
MTDELSVLGAELSTRLAEMAPRTGRTIAASKVARPSVARRPSPASTNIDVYLAQLPDWQRQIGEKLRALVHKAAATIVEEWKWTSPYFSHNGPVCFFWASKNFVKFTFRQGSLLVDQYQAFDSEPENLHNRSIRYTDAKDVEDKVIIEYVKQAVANNLQDKKIVVKGRTRPTLTMSPEIRATFQKAGLMKVYEARPYYQRNGYLSWIAEGKQEATRQKRVVRMLDELREGTYMPPQSKRYVEVTGG